jgi:hypothetical protein
LVINGRQIHLGYYQNKDDAVAKRKEGEVKYHQNFSKSLSRKNETT